MADIDERSRGIHFPFVSDDLKGGGHALSFTTAEVAVDIQVIRQHTTWLPTDELLFKAPPPFVSPQ